MRLSLILVLACLCAGAAAGKAALLAKLGARGRHHKRGTLGSVPTYKLGHDIPVVSHSVVKPFLVTYPPTAVPVRVKVPLANPLLRYPVPVGHKVPVPHPHYGLKFPHFNKNFPFSKPDHHFHHHHHHVAPKPVVPVLPSPPAPPIVPVALPSAPVASPIPPPPHVLVPTHVTPTRPLPLPQPAPPPIHFLPQQNVHFNPILPAAPVALQPTPPVFPIAPQFPYVIRPGNAVQASLFATYPRYPLGQYPPPILPATPVYLQRPQAPPYHLIPQTPTVAVHAAHDVAPILLHPTHHPVAVSQQALDHEGWSPVPTHLHDQAQFPQEHVLQHHAEEQHYHEYHDQVQHQIQDLEQAQYEHNINELHQHQHHHGAPHDPAQFEYPQHISQEYGQPSQEQQLQQEYGAPQQQLGQEYGVPQQQLGQEYGFPQQQLGQEYGVPQQQLGQEYGVPQQQLGQEYGAPQQHLGQEYSLPEQHPGHEYQQSGFEGRNISELGQQEQQQHEQHEQQEQAYHNHIPLGLQPPIDRPLDHFR